MPRRITATDGTVWDVSLSGRRTQYSREEVSLEFAPVDPLDGAHRYARFAPRGAKSAERAYEEVSDQRLRRLLDIAQPGWTSPDGAYRRAE